MKPDWFSEEIHGVTAMLSRQAARTAGVLNPRLRGIRGLKDLAAELDRRKGKPVFGKPEPLPLLPKAARPARRKSASVSVAQLPRMTPKHSHAAKKGFPRPAPKWDERCSTCAGTGFVVALDGGKVDCPKCAG